MTAVQTITEVLTNDEPFAVPSSADLAAAAFLARYSKRTFEAYRHDLRTYFQWAGDAGLEVFAATRGHIELYRATLEERGLAPTTIDRRLSTVCGFYRFAHIDGRIASNPAQYVRRPRIFANEVRGMDRGVGLGVLGTRLVTPGQSLAAPTAWVAGIGGVVVLASWVVASFRVGRQAGWIFAVSVAVVTVLASIWTFEFALPTAIQWSNAATQAQNALSSMQHSSLNHNGTVPAQPCVVHETGSVGPLAAPYRECAIWTPVSHLISFIADGPGSQGGLVYTKRPSTSFEDQCVRHLVGDWWMFAPSTNAGGNPGSCYIGYHFSGGG